MDHFKWYFQSVSPYFWDLWDNKSIVKGKCLYFLKLSKFIQKILQYPKKHNDGSFLKKFILIILIFYPLFSYASVLNNEKEYNYDYNCEIIEQSMYQFLRKKSSLNPDNNILNLSGWTNRFHGDIDFNMDYRAKKLIIKLRPTILTDESITKLEMIFDDAYIDLKLKDNIYFFTGKKNVRDGVGLSTNPTDFLGEDKKMDPTKREEERRVEREGNYLVGVDTYFKDISITAILAPFLKNLQEERNRLLFKATIFYEDINTDISFHYFNSNKPGIGYNISTIIGNDLVLYSEMSFRKGGRNKIVESNNMNNQHIINNRNKIFPHIVTGGHYTFINGTNIILEYIYNGDGYNSKEWSNFIEIIKNISNEYNNGHSTDQMKAYLLQANNMMHYREMRKNYLFMRISNPNIKKKIDGALALFLNIDDKSFVINPSFEYNIKNKIKVEFFGLFLMGNDTTEFGISPLSNEIGMALRYYY